MVDAKPVQFVASATTIPRECAVVRMEKPPRINEAVLRHGSKVLATTKAGPLRLSVAASGPSVPVTGEEKRGTSLL